MTISWWVLLVVLHGLIVPPVPEIASRDYWRPTYSCALEKARDQGRPLLIVLEDGSDVQQQLTTLHSPKLERFLDDFQLCRLDVQTTEGKRLAEQYGASELPYIVITDQACKNVVFRGAGQFGMKSLSLTLAAHGGNDTSRWPADESLADSSQPKSPAEGDERAETPKPLFPAHERLEDVQRVQRETGKPLFVMVTTDGCFHCNRLRSSTLSEERVCETLRDNFEPVLVHVNEHPEWVRRHGVRIYPTLLIVAPNGSLVDRIEGYVDADQLLDRMQQLERSMISLLW